MEEKSNNMEEINENFKEKINDCKFLN